MDREKGLKMSERDFSKEFYDILSELEADSKVHEMKKYIQHGKVSTFEHCENVAKLSYKLNKYLSLHSDLKVLITGAMLHDFYLYDWHREDDGSHRLHGFHHAKTASVNAEKHFHTDPKVNKVIESHMWPLNIGKLPKSREAWIVCIADKCISAYETLFRR